MADSKIIRTDCLEARIQISYWTFSNQVVVDTENGKTRYAGRVKVEFSLEPLVIQMIPLLEKYSVMDRGLVQRRKLVSLIPPRFETENVPIVKERRVWRVGGWNRWAESYDDYVSRMSCRWLGTEFGEWNYREKLTAAAEKQGLLLSSKLLDMVFHPIDDGILSLYAKGLRSRP